MWSYYVSQRGARPKLVVRPQKVEPLRINDSVDLGRSQNSHRSGLRKTPPAAYAPHGLAQASQSGSRFAASNRFGGFLTC